MIKTKSAVLAIVLILALTSTTIPMFTTTSAALPYTEITGKLNGASYLIQIPNPIESWNRNLVVYCHGFSHTEPQPPLSSAGLAAPLIASGFAFAMSSYGMGGYYISTAMNNSYLLTQYVKNTYNVTGQIFLIGISQGGGISLQVAEKYPNLYSGVLDLSGSKDLKMSYNTRMDFLSAKNDSEIASKLLTTGSAVPPYPFPTLQAFQTFNSQQVDDLVNATGGTPTTAPKAYEDISADYHANISIPIITVHAKGDPVNTYAQALAYQAAVNAAGKSNLYRLYTTDGTGHVDATVTNQISQRLQELVAWSNAINQDWTLVTNARTMKAYPNLRESIWQKNASMAVTSPYDKIGLHRLVNPSIPSKGVVFITDCPTWGTGEERITNPPTDNWTKTENFSQAIYLANRGYDVYAIDYRTHFVPNNLATSQMGFMANWSWDVWVYDIKEAAEQAKTISGTSKFFISGECSGAEAALNYATKYSSDLRGIILLDPNFLGVNPPYPIVDTPRTTNTYNLTTALANMDKAQNWTRVDWPQWFKDWANYALQNPGAPAISVNGTAATPTINPLTNKTWTNMTEYFAYSVTYNFGLPATPGLYSNVLGGYGNTTQDEYCFANSEYVPLRLYYENAAMSDWVNCPYMSYDYNDHYKDINVPVITFESSIFGNRAGPFQFVNGMATTDFTGVMLPNYGHMDVFIGTYSARDVSQPTINWMTNHYQPPTVSAFTSVTMMTGQTWYFFANSAGTAGPNTYQWYEGTTMLTGQTSMLLVMTKATAGTYTYTCKVTDVEGTSATSNTVTLTVINK
jgi:pimeloyl-ACP methyl ester carboxylesterase